MAGVGFGLLLFVAEGALILRPGAAGIGLSVQGPLLALFQVAKPFLPGLLMRVALVYAFGGALLGSAAALLVLCTPARRRAAVVALWTVELVLLTALLVADRAIARPALVDDLAIGWPGFDWLVTEASPWYPRTALAALLAGHLILAAWRLGAKLWPAVGALAVVSVLAVALKSPDATRLGTGPLVVLIGIDAFRPDRLKMYGGSGEVAPNLEAFARDATFFDRAYTPLAQTEPAWRSLLTARWPYRTGVRYPLTAERRWAPSSTFAEELGRLGYSTAFHTDCSRFNYQGPLSGFEVREQPPRGAINFVLEKVRFRAAGMLADNALGSAWIPELVDNRALAGTYDPIGYGQRLGDSLVKQARGGPALFAFHATSAHFPGDPVYPFYRRFVDRREPLQRRIRMFFSPVTGSTSSGWNRASSEALYDELLSQADAQLGILFDALKRGGLYEEALIVVFSDHGESFFGDIPSLAGATPVHGARLGEEENRILLAIKLPASRAPKSRPDRVAALVRLIDVGPTLLELSGAAPLFDADGVSLVPLLEGRRMAKLNLLAETGFTHATPDAFDPTHFALAPRTLDAYDIRPDGAVEVSTAAHQAVMKEKDFGAFDGARWIIRSPSNDGSVVQKCRGECPAPDLQRWFDKVLADSNPAGS